MHTEKVKTLLLSVPYYIDTEKYEAAVLWVPKELYETNDDLYVSVFDDEGKDVSIEVISHDCKMSD